MVSFYDKFALLNYDYGKDNSDIIMTYKKTIMLMIVMLRYRIYKMLNKKSKKWNQRERWRGRRRERKGAERAGEEKELERKVRMTDISSFWRVLECMYWKKCVTVVEQCASRWGILLSNIEYFLNI